MASITVRPSEVNTQEERMKNLERALGVFKKKVKDARIIEQYVDKQHFVTKAEIRKKQKARKKFMSQKFTDY
jgi:ribosomal protein S21